MIKSILAISFTTFVAIAGVNTTSGQSNGEFSSPAAQASWTTGADMSTHGQQELAVASARSLLVSHGIREDVDQQYWPSPSGTYNCSSGCSRTCSYTCSTNYRCRY